MSGGLGRFAAGLALKGVLKRLTGRAEPAAIAAEKARRRRRTAGRDRSRTRQSRPATRARGPVAHPPARGMAFFVMMGSIALAVPLMLLFHHPITRVVGVVMLFTFILSGVFAIAQPSFLEADDQEHA